MIDFTIQFISAFGLLVGLYLMGNKVLLGPVLAFVAEIAVTIVGITHNAWSIVVIGVGLGAVQLRNFLKWRVEGAKWLILVLMLGYSSLAYATSTHTCQGNADCSTNGGGSITSTITNTNTANGGSGGSVGEISNNSNASGTGEGGSASTGNVNVNSSNKVKSYSHGFSAASGQDSFQLGSLLFGSLTISTDTRTGQIRANLETILNLYKAGLVDEATMKNYVATSLTELKKETQGSKFLGIIPQGKDRKISNLFKLL